MMILKTSVIPKHSITAGETIRMHTTSGNHEDSVKTNSNYFQTTTQIFDLRFDVVGINSKLWRICQR